VQAPRRRSTASGNSKWVFRMTTVSDGNEHSRHDGGLTVPNFQEW
jgi:hypothetical protein